MPVVGLPNVPVPHTVMPRSAAAARSIEALRMPVVIRSLRSGSASSVAQERRALAHHADDREALERGDDLVGAAERLIEDLDLDVGAERRPVGDLSATFW